MGALILWLWSAYWQPIVLVGTKSWFRQGSRIKTETDSNNSVFWICLLACTHCSMFSQLRKRNLVTYIKLSYKNTCQTKINCTKFILNLKHFRDIKVFMLLAFYLTAFNHHKMQSLKILPGSRSLDHPRTQCPSQSWLVQYPCSNVWCYVVSYKL